jgi:hypothetical protein
VENNFFGRAGCSIRCEGTAGKMAEGRGGLVGLFYREIAIGRNREILGWLGKREMIGKSGWGDRKMADKKMDVGN